MANLQDAFQKLYETAIKEGANGVINVKMEYLRSFIDPATKDDYSSRWVVIGMLIKK